MTERFEWIEPEEAVQERQKQHKMQLHRERIGVSLCALLVGFALITLLTLYNFDSSEVLAVIVTICIILPLLLLQVTAEARRQAEPDARQYTLYDDAEQWEQLRSFEIADHPTLPGIRSLNLRAHHRSDSIRLDFRAGQIDESQLRQFLESRIAEQRAQRLMRRIKH